MIGIIKMHLDRYPEMTIQDVFKLIYQSEFGGGHFVQDEQKSLKRIEDEYSGMQNQERKDTLLWEPIGGEMCRIYLDASKQGLSAVTLNKMFVTSANTKRGTVEGLEKKLEAFLEMCEETGCFAVMEVRHQIEVWKEQGYQAISHSEVYREHYMPAYRVAELKYGKFLEVFLRIDRVNAELSDNDKLMIGIDGMCGSGKSTLGELLMGIYEGNLFHMDDFFLQPHQRTKERLATAGGNVDYERFKEEVLLPLQRGEIFSYNVFDCSRQQIAERVQVSDKRLNIIEGAYCQHPYFKSPYNLQFFLKISASEQVKRLSVRNGERMLERFVKEWIPMEQAYFEAFAIEAKSVCIWAE